MTLGPYAAFIVGAYAAVALVVAALIGWVVGDYVRQAARLRAFAARGVLRRSARDPA